MVFESLLTDLLNKYLGQYVENLDSSQLKFGIWRGNVVLQNLYLKQSALDELDLPVKTLFGCLEKLTLQIPWNNLYNSPVIASIEGLYILAVPNQAIKYDPVKDEKARQEEKQAELKKIEEAKKKEKQSGKKAVDPGFVEKLSAQIIKNIEVTIKNIHVRFEDRISCPGRIFALGATLDSLTVKTINHWGPKISVDPVNLIFKELAISCLCLYWNCNIKDLFSNSSSERLISLFSQGINTPENRPKQYDYMLGPLNAVSKLRINTKPELDNSNYTVPKILLVSDLPDLIVRISKNQFSDLICVIEAIDIMQRSTQYRKYRPNLTQYKGHAKQWWKFAYNAILEEEIRRRKRGWNWEHIKQHRKLIHDYFKAYKEKLSSAKPDAKTVALCSTLEEKLDAFNIILVRERVELEVSKEERRDSSSSGGGGGGWLSNWWYGGSKPAQEKESQEENFIEKFENAMTSEEKEKLFRAIDYSEGDLPTEFPKQFVELSVEVILHTLEFDIVNVVYENPAVLKINFNEVNLAFKQRTSGLFVLTSVGSFDIIGCVQGDFVPKIVTTLGTKDTSSKLLEVSFETKPLDNENCDKRVRISAQPLSVVYDAVTIERTVEVFQPEKPIKAATIQSAVQLKLAQIKQISALGLQNMIEKHEVLDLDIYLMSSNIVVPKGGILDNPEKTRLVLSSGTIKIKSIALDRAESSVKNLRAKYSEEMTIKTLELHSYDYFKLNLTEFQVILALENEKLTDNLESELYLLKPTTLNIDIKKCIIPEDPRLPRLKVNATLEGIRLNIAMKRLQKLLDLVMTLPSGSKPPLPPSESEVEPPLSKWGSNLSLLAEKTKSPKPEIKKPKEEIIQFTELVLDFELKELNLTVIENDKQFLNFKVSTVNVDLIQQTFDQKIHLKLIDVDLVQIYDSKPIKVIQTMTSDKKNYLFSVEYINVNKRSPEFHSVYGSVLQTIRVDFTSLKFFMHCEALLELLSKLQALFPPSNPLPKVQSKSVPALTLDTIFEEKSSSRRYTRNPSTATSKIKETKKPKQPSDAISIKIEFALGQLEMSLANKNEVIMDFRISGGEAGIILRAAYTAVNAQLKGIELINLATTSKYAKVVSLVDETEALKAKVVLFNDHPSNTSTVDLKIQAQISRLRFVFIKSFVDRVLNFTNHFQDAQQAILDASAAAAEAAKQNVQQAYEKATKVELSIDLKAPIIFVPISEKSAETFVLDFGFLKAENEFREVTTTKDIHEPAVLDRIHVSLNDLKLFRATLDESLNYVEEAPMISPITFKLSVQRNLSCSWFTDIPDLEVACAITSVGISISHNNYVFLMKMLEENLGSKPPERELPQVPVSPSLAKHKDSLAIRDSTYTSSDTFPKASSVTESKIARIDFEQSPRMAVKFLCNLDEVVIKIIDPTDKSGQSELAKITLHVISVKGSMLSDGSLQLSLLLLDLIIDDTRPSQVNKINRYMERKKENLTAKSGKASLNTMVDIVYQQKKETVFANVRVSTFVLMLNMEHLLKVASVFTLPAKPAARAHVSVAAKTRMSTINPDSTKKLETSEDSLMTFAFRCEQPCIIFVENMENIDTNVLIMHCEILFKSRTSGSHQSVSGSIKDLQLFSSCYNPLKRDSTKIPILEPFSLDLAGTTPEGKGLHAELSSTRIQLSVTPGIIQLLSNVSSAITGKSDEELAASSGFIDRTDMWEVQKFEDTDYAFLKTELAEEAVETDTVYIVPPEVKSELCVFTVPAIVINIETGYGSNTIPVLHMETSMKAYIRNWNSLLNIDSNIQLQVSYYNHSLALWEPIVEPVEQTVDGNTEIIPWGLSVQVKKNKEHQEDDHDHTITSFDKCDDLKPAMSITVASKESMPVTVTKTCLGVLQQLSSSFSDAIYKPAEASTDEPPCVFINESGIVVAVRLESSGFKVWKQELESTKEVILDNGARLNLSSKSVKISGAGDAEIDSRTFIEVHVEKYNCTLKLPISREDKRYFPLNFRGSNNDNWGLVSEVVIRNGRIIATLRGIIQLKNYFDVPISVYYMTKKGNEVSYVNKIQPDSKLNLPLEAIYTPTSELFFSVEGYSVSVVPFVWKDLQQSLSNSMIMKCNPKNIEDKDPFFIRASGELEQVFYERTTRHTMASSCYNISLRPTAMFKNLLPTDVNVVVQGRDLSVAQPQRISPGEMIQIPTAEPGHSSLIVQIPNYLDKDWSCKHQIEENPDELTVWTFNSYESSVPMMLELGLHTTDANKSILMELYCPFWMINKTGLLLSYKRSNKAEKESPSELDEKNANVLYHPDDLPVPILFSFKSKNFFVKKKSQLRVLDGQWSEKFSLDVAGSAGSVQCVRNGKIYNIGITIQLTYGTLTKQVMFTPFFVVVNHWSVDLEFQEVGSEEWNLVKEKGCVPFWPDNKSSNFIKVRVVGTTETTVEFPYKTIHHSLFKLENKYGAVTVDIQVSDGGTYIALFPYEQGMAPALILNHTKKEIEIADKANDITIKLNRNEQVLFAWYKVEPKHVMMVNNKTSISIQGDDLGTVEDSDFYWTCFLHGVQRILLFTDERQIAEDAQQMNEFNVALMEIEIAISGISISLVDNINKCEVLHMGITNTGLAWQTRKKSRNKFKPLSDRESAFIEEAYQNYLSAIDSGQKVLSQVVLQERITVDFATMEMLKPSHKELKRAFKNGFWCSIIQSKHTLQLHSKINRIQIDNQLFDCVFPVVLAPIPPPKSVAAHIHEKPFVEVSIVKRMNDYSVIQQYKYFKVLVQEFDVKIDAGFISALSEMFEAEEVKGIREKEIAGFQEDLKFKDLPLHFHVVRSSMRDQKHFYDYLHLSPLKMHLSFTLSSGVRSTPGAVSDNKAKTIPPIINLATQSLGVTLTDVQGVVFKLGYFEREYCFLTANQLMQEVQAHYLNQLVKQLYVLVLGLDVIGNPFGLMVGLGQGAADLFYEPFQGAIQGPGEFVTGIFYGVRSLIGHTVGGAAGAVSKITGAMGKGLAALTFDQDYQRQRREMVGHKPANFQEGLAQSGKGLAMGFFDGVTGVVRQPFYGARDEGVGGFCKGVGKGLVGLVTRPITGLTDFASGSFNAVKRATDISEDVLRMRAPRFIQADGLVKPFSQREAEGSKMLLSVDKGKYMKTDMYVYHIVIGKRTEKKDVLLLTDQRIGYISINEIFGSYQMDWSYKWTEIEPPAEIIDKGIVVRTKKKGKKNLFYTDSGKMVIIEKEELKNSVAAMMNDLILKSASK